MSTKFYSRTCEKFSQDPRLPRRIFLAANHPQISLLLYFSDYLHLNRENIALSQFFFGKSRNKVIAKKSWFTESKLA